VVAQFLKVGQQRSRAKRPSGESLLRIIAAKADERRSRDSRGQPL
jgi:hypothetical protein